MRGVALFVKDSYSFNKRDDLSINSVAIQSLSIEITNNESENIIFNVVYRPPYGDIMSVKFTLRTSFSKTM